MLETVSIDKPAERVRPIVVFARMAAGLAGLFLLLVLGATLLREYSGFHTFLKSGVVQSEFNTETTDAGDTVRVFTSVDPRDFPSGLYPVKGDTLTHVGGIPLTQTFWREVFARPLPPDTTIPITVNGEQGVHEYTLQAQPEQSRNVALLVFIDVLRFLIAFGFIGVGLWAFFAQPNSMPVRVFAWFCFGMTTTMISGVNIMNTFYVTIKIPGLEQVRQGLGMLALGTLVFWLHLQLVFPTVLDFVKRNAKWIYPVIYFPWLVSIVIAVLSLLNWITPDLANTVANFSVIPIFIGGALGFVILGRRFGRSKDRVEKRQLRLVLWGTALGLGSFLILLILLNVFREWFVGSQMRTYGAITLGFTMLLLTPISYAYAFGRYRLLEVQGKLKRGTRYLLTSSVAFLVLFGGAYLFVRNLLTGNSAIGALLLVLFAFGIGRISSRMNKFLEGRFYPERQQLRTRLQSALESSTSLGDCRQFWSQISEHLRQSLNVATVYPVLAGENGGTFALRDHELTPFTPTSDFVSRLHHERRAVFVDELVASGKTKLSEDEYQWLSLNNVALILPLITQQRMAGFLAFGYKTEEEDYIPEEVSVLSTIAPQVAMASENMRLLEENVEKRRLEEQMQMARRIQEGFLPQVLPETKGLEIATHNRFSLEVAGDYFDVMNLPDGQSLIAIADVSGKGAGAALLMANLQASLRTAMEVGVPLTRAVAQVNNLIFRNTPPEQYITFVAVLFDPVSSMLYFVNAGHNPPLLVRTDGSIEELEPTGLILGAIPNMEYGEGAVEFKQNELLVLYTDGVSEAMNDDEEEYGEDRIKETALCLRHESVSHIIDEIERDVERFCGRVPMEDDSTMIVVKRL
ncbi:MAG: SpoIIE family protein phosphatase [Calditrichaeota bacterium]|nr:SpoIIE family protein phosphatase [Calditrichota bacterium]